MNFFEAFQMLKSSLPVFKSFFKAYKHVNSGRSGGGTQVNNDRVEASIRTILHQYDVQN